MGFVFKGGREVALLLFVGLTVAYAFAPGVAAEGWPHVVIVSPDAGATVSGIVTVMGHAWDDVEVIKVLVGIDAGERSLATDTSGNATWWSWEWVWNTTKWENGWHHIVAIAYDNEGLAGDIGIEVYVENPVDEPPRVEIVTPEEGAVLSGIVNITGAARDDVGVLFVKIRIDVDGPVYLAEDTSGNGTWWTWALAWDSRDVPNGEHVIYAKAVDTKEHVGWDSVHVKVMNEGGNTAPWVDILEPKGGSTVFGVVTIRGAAGDHDPDDRIEVVQVRIDAGEWQNATDTSDLQNWAHWAFEWDTAHVETGWHHVYARAFDGDAYSEIDVIELYVKHEGDNHRPEVRIDAPAHGSEVHGIVLVHGRAWDPDEGDHVTGVWVSVDGGEWHLAKDITDNASWFVWGWVWDTTKWENGWHAVCAKSFDGELYSERACVEVNVQNEKPADEPPVVTIENPENGSTVDGIVLIWGLAWDDREVGKVQVRIDGGEWVLAIDTSGNHSWATWAWSWDTRGYDDGEHVVRARAWDGHQFSEVVEIVVIVDNPDGIDGFLRSHGLGVGFTILAGTIGASLLLWWRRFGPMAGLR